MPNGVNPQVPESIVLSGQGSSFARSQGSMPGDLLESARIRVRTACLVVAALWLNALVMNEVVSRLLGSAAPVYIPRWEPPQTVFTIVGLILSLAVAWWVNTMHDRPAMAIDVGLVVEVL